MRALVVMVAALVAIPGLALAGDMRLEASHMWSSRAGKRAAPSTEAGREATKAPVPQDFSKQGQTSQPSKP